MLDMTAATAETLRLSPVDPYSFAHAMRGRWEGFGNTSNTALMTTWRHIATAFETQILNHEGPARGRWAVVGTPTGTGKSTGLALYCAMLASNPGSEDVGALIVVQFTKDADELAKDINAIAGPGTAIAKHSKASARKVTAEQLSAHRVAIVTHVAFKAMMGAFRNERLDASHEALLRWDRGPRVLRVIDEALDVVASTRISSDELLAILPALGGYLRRKHGKALRLINAAAGLIDEAGSEGDETILSDRDEAEAVETRDEVAKLLWARSATQELAERFPSREPLDALIDDLHEHKGDEAASTVETLENLIQVLTSWAWSSRSGAQEFLATGRKLVPDGFPGMVALDATAGVNLTWKLLRDELEQEAHVIGPVPGARDYGNVTVYVHRTTQGLGKKTTENRGQARLDRLREDLKAHLSASDKLLLVTHKVPGKAIREEAAEWAERFGVEELGVTWHGDYIGRNDWQTFSAIAITSLPYPPTELATNTLGALLGAPDAEWFGDRKAREMDIDGETIDPRQRMVWSTIATQVTQAVHRVRMRRVEGRNRDKGGCEETKVFLLLPRSALGGYLEETVMASLPGAVQRPWKVDTLVKGRKKLTLSETILGFLAEAEAGQEFTVEELQAVLEIANKRSLQKALETMSDLDLEAVGARRGLRPTQGRGRPKSLIMKEKMMID